MNRISRRAGVLLGGLALGGCQAVSSADVASLTSTDRANGRAAGTVYSLPRVLVAAQLRLSDTGGLSVTLGSPTTVADTGIGMLDHSVVSAADRAACADEGPAVRPARTFVLSHRVSGFHEDRIKVEVRNGLLTSVTADTQERSSQALVALGTSVGRIIGSTMGFESAVALARDEVLGSWIFDPADCLDRAAVNAGLNRLVTEVGLPRLRRLQAAGGRQGPLAGLDLRAVRTGDFAVTIGGYQPFRYPAGAGASPEDCRVGICVPVVRQATLSLRSNGHYGGEPISLALPNGSDPTPVPVSRSAFANVTTTVALQDGVLTSSETSRTSEALAIARLPGDVIGAVLGGIVSGLNDRKSLADAEVAASGAIRQARENRANLEASRLREQQGSLVRTPLPGLGIATRQEGARPGIRQGGGNPTELVTSPPAGGAGNPNRITGGSNGQ